MKSNLRVDIAILGGGIAGLGASLGAKRQQRDAVVFEASKSAGGLLDNFSIQGFRFDNAVHLSFATEPEVRAIFDQTPFFTHASDSLNFETERWLKHPVQNNLYPLDADDKVTLIESFLARPENVDIENYQDWLIHQYGHGIAERYPIRYTKKYWQCEANELSTTWIGNRMRRAEFGEILRGSYTSDTPNTYYTKEMRYPVKGGYKQFIKPLLDDANILLEHRAIAIDLKEKLVTFSNGLEVRYNDLVNTLPLPLFIELCGQQVPSDVRESALQLEATSIDLISVGFNKAIVKDLWFYIYDEDILASRAYSPSVKSSDNVPDGCSSLQFEVYNPSQNSQHTSEELKENVLYALAKMKIAVQEDIIFMEHKHLPWGNVVFKLGMESHRKNVLDFIKNQKIYTAGRFGEWEYFWSNQSFLSGFNLVYQSDYF
ncbi:NAD(P)-binding protein [Vibrio vulnificus]|nr:NAD(P)-binding protein [Vibrio vulnificus]ELQ2465496.1 NAD(P)-binding protein [Vibrio vulnificus]